MHTGNITALLREVAFQNAKVAIPLLALGCVERATRKGLLQHTFSTRLFQCRHNTNFKLGLHRLVELLHNKVLRLLVMTRSTPASPNLLPLL